MKNCLFCAEYKRDRDMVAGRDGFVCRECLGQAHDLFAKNHAHPFLSIVESQSADCALCGADGLECGPLVRGRSPSLACEPCIRLMYDGICAAESERPKVFEQEAGWSVQKQRGHILETIRPDEPDYAPAGLLDRIIGVYDALSEVESENNAELVKEWRNVLSDFIELARTMIRGPKS